MTDTERDAARWRYARQFLAIEGEVWDVLAAERQAHNAAQMAAEALSYPKRSDGIGHDVTWRNCEYLVAQLADYCGRLREPTPEMLAAGVARSRTRTHSLDETEVRLIFAAMVEAAALPPEAPHDGRMNRGAQEGERVEP